MGRPDPSELLTRVIESMDSGEDRPQQRQMVEAVDRAFRTRTHLAVQGPTGVGKSVAYLLPAITSARSHADARTIVVTSSKALQDQLGERDLPFLADALDVPFRFAVLKGRSNYLCQAAVAETRVQLGRGEEQQTLDLGGGWDGDGSVPEVRAPDPLLRRELDRLLEWAGTTPTGELAELADPPSDPAWSALSVGPGECVGASRCGYAAECFSEQARERAGGADIVVVNAHLYAADVQAGGQLLPVHDHLVIDEAHEFEDAMVGALGVSMTGWRIRRLAQVHDRCVADAPTVAMAIGAAADAVDDALEQVFGEVSIDRGSGRLTGELPDVIADALTRADLAVDRAVNSLREVHKAAGNAPMSAAAHRFERAIRNCDGVSDDLHALRDDLHPGQVRWISEGRRGRFALNLTRIDIGPTLRATAWERRGDDDSPDAATDDGDGSGGPTVVMCSATLDPGTAGRLGLRAEYLAVDSPFDFRRHGLLYVPRLPRPNAEAWPDAVVDELVHVIERCGGRTLALFTSHRMLRRSVDAVRDRLPDADVLAQGDAPNRVLQERFLANEHASLFATASFWTGISSPGTTCSAVVVDKIPFPVPTDPIVEARCDAVGAERAFMEVSVPAAGVQLAQGVGRLIRTATDRGVVAVLDPRLAEARYRARILDRLPRMKRTRERSELDAFIDSLELD
ncbi:MAG TPA: ATP-dependent DNA helicase [Microthrixaceae bacterium]|nr:ATP-dependent DNA helicase [Microthrixaceae bacterium]